MAGKRPLEVITPPNMLRVKAGGRVGTDMSAVARAEEALQALSGEFGKWIQSEVEGLDAARRAVQQNGVTGPAGEKLYRCALDLKGLGATYGYPIVSQIAGLLSKLLEARPEPSTRVLRLIDANVDAIRAAVRDGVMSEDHPVGRALAAELSAQTAAIVPAE